MEYVGTSYNGGVKDGRFFRYKKFIIHFLNYLTINFILFIRFEGKGKYNFSTGTNYEGELKDGMFHGKGNFINN
jgi:hypothetical protein